MRNGLPETTKQQVMEILLYFVCQNCTDMQFFTLQVIRYSYCNGKVQTANFFFVQAIGSVCIRHYDFMLGESLKSIYLNVSKTVFRGMVIPLI